VKIREREEVFFFFFFIAHHPHPSRRLSLSLSQSVLAWLKSFAEARSLPWQQDAVGNIVIRRPGSGGGEAAPPIILQGHVDMVCEKNEGTPHDFTADPIRLVMHADGWLRAAGTTLGADNGIGVAAALAVLDTPRDSAARPLPPIEALFTVDEETGLTGAFGLDGAMLAGRTLINLDTEDWGDLFIGCAGGGDSKITLPVESEGGSGRAAEGGGGAPPPPPPPPPPAAIVTISVTGLLGGHSGLCIHEGRGNAVALAARLAEACVGGGGGRPAVRVVSFAGGDKRNAIPRECVAVLAVLGGGGGGDARGAAAAARAEGEAVAAEYGGLETGLCVDVAVDMVDTGGGGGAGPPPAYLTAASSDALLTLLRTLPHGALRMSTAVPGLVETSTNLASVGPVKGQAQGGGEAPPVASFAIQTSTRSSLLPALEAVRRSIAACARSVGGTCVSDEAYPGWAPNPASRIVRLTAAAVEGVTGRAPKIGAIHAGLECGIIGARVPGGLDCVSFGPTITGAHSPDEAVRVDTVAPFYEALLAVLGALAAEGGGGGGAAA